jgi:hypothetical protein
MFIASNKTMMPKHLSINRARAKPGIVRGVMKPPEINLLFAWAWIVAGFASGMVMGLFFNREDWLGGYTSLKRRLFRLAHISFFGLGAVNLMFYFTARYALGASVWQEVAAWGFVVGGITMPLACVIMARWTQAKAVFAVPVTSLLLSGALMIWELAKL